MGYFAETMALFEFKGDAEAAYSSRNAAERLSGDHTIGRAAYAAGKLAVNSSGSSRNAKEYLGRKNDTAKTKQAMDVVGKDNDARDMLKSGIKTAYKYGKGKDEELRKTINKYQTGSNKGIKESFDSAFGSVIL